MWLSDCCGAEPDEFFDIHFDLLFSRKPIGMCGDCKEHCDFDYDQEENDN